MKKITLTFLIIFLVSCNKKKIENKMVIKIADDSLKKTENIIKSDNYKKKDTLKIIYSEHKNLLNILTILPDSTMRSWGWKKSERKQFIDDIKINECTTSSAENFSKFELIQPNTIRIQVVDGCWILSIYKVKTNNFIVITNDIVGDGNDVQTYEYINNELNYIEPKNLFGEYFNELRNGKNNLSCKELMEDFKIGLTYNFETKTKIQISNMSYSENSENNKCLKGNTLNYEFNPRMKKFEIVKINWTK